jgi:carbamoyl-phosphate synthase large subunit
MRSTGEVMSFGANFPEAFAKAQIAAGNPLPSEGTVLVSLADADKREGVALVGQLHDRGFRVVATRGTAQALRAMGIPAETVLKVGEGRPDCVDVIVQGKIDLVVNTPSADGQERQRSAPPLPATARERGVRLPWAQRRSAGYRIRTAALECHVPYITTPVALRATVAAIRSLRPGHVSVRELGERGFLVPKITMEQVDG